MNDRDAAEGAATEAVGEVRVCEGLDSIAREMYT